MRGYQKRVIHVKNTGSNVFEEAYFVLKEDFKSAPSRTSLVDEATRIINENTVGRKKGILKGIRVALPAFLVGVLISVIVFLIIEIT